MGEYTYDVFLSHASEDKDEVANELFAALENRGMRVWYDRAELKAGDSLSGSIDAGLSNARYGIVVFSNSFFEKSWPRHELAGLRARQMGGQQVIIPVWHQVGRDDVVKFSPPLADMMALNTGDGIDKVASQILEIAKPEEISNWLQEKSLEVLANFSKSEHQGSEFDYWPKGGLRNLYNRLVNFSTFAQIRRRFGKSVFVSGPHSDYELDLFNPEDFGHYNIEFVRWFDSNVKRFLSSPFIVKSTRDTFSNNFEDIALLYYITFKFMDKNPRVITYLEDGLASTLKEGADAYQFYRNISFIDNLPNPHPVTAMMSRLDNMFDANRACSAVYYWMRRRADGTAEKIFLIISRLLKVYSGAELGNINSYTDWNLGEGEGPFRADFPEINESIRKFVELVDSGALQNKPRIKIDVKFAL